MGLEPVQGTPAPVAPTPAIPEVAAQTTPEVAKPDDKLSARYVELARREREAQAQRNKQKQAESKYAEMEAKYKAYEDTKAQARLNPIKALEQLGLTPDDLVQFQLNNGQATPDLAAKQAMSEIEQLRAELRQRDEQQTKAQQESQQRAVQEAMENFKVDTKSFVESKPEDYELINATESHDMVIQTIEEHWNQSVQRYEESGQDPLLKPKILSKEDAAGLVEKFLEEKVEKVLAGKRFGSKYKKIEEKVADAIGQVAQETKQNFSTQSGVKTLHNGMTAGLAPGPNSAKSLQEKMERAAALLKNQKG